MAKADYQKRTAQAVAAVLEGLGRGDDLEELTQTLAGITDKNDLDVGEGLLRLAAEVLDLGGFTASAPLAYEDLRERYLPEIEFHGKVAHRNSQYALYAAAAIHGGVLPDTAFGRRMVGSRVVAVRPLRPGGVHQSCGRAAGNRPPTDLTRAGSHEGLVNYRLTAALG